RQAFVCARPGSDFGAESPYDAFAAVLRGDSDFHRARFSTVARTRLDAPVRTRLSRLLPLVARQLRRIAIRERGARENHPLHLPDPRARSYGAAAAQKGFYR